MEQDPPPVVNPTSCVWDPDDYTFHHAVISTYATLDPGRQTSMGGCSIADWVYNAVRVRVVADTPALNVNVCYATQGRCFDLSGSVPVQITKRIQRYQYDGCILIRYDQNDPALGVIPDSNGGIGLLSPLDLTISNLSASQARVYGADLEIFGAAEFYGFFAAPCPPVSESAGPFTWAHY